MREHEHVTALRKAFVDNGLSGHIKVIRKVSDAQSVWVVPMASTSRATYWAIRTLAHSVVGLPHAHVVLPAGLLPVQATDVRKAA